MFEVNLIAVVVSTALAIVIGMLWYSPKTFGTVWAREAGVDMAAGASEGMWKMMLAGAIQNFVIIYILSHFLILAEAYPGADALIGAVWMAILVAATHLGSVIWEKKSLTYFSVNAGYLATILIVSALVITRWPWA